MKQKTQVKSGDKMNGLIESLNEEQKKAALTLEGPLLILAGAGSGKTRVVTYRIAHMLEVGIAPNKILGLTFTNKAAAEMKERVHKLTSSHVLICTFHSLGAKILRESIHHLGYTSGFTIYDEEDISKLLKACIEELGIKNKKLEPKAFRQMISHAKNRVLTPLAITESLEKPESEIEQLFPAVYTLYQTKLKNYNALDFDDLLFLPVLLFRENNQVLEYYQNRFSHLLIDEYQDTNSSQYELAKQLVKKSGNIFVVGDPDQSIYSWRGADISNILNFEKDYPGAKVIKLEENYRSCTNILQAANALISNNKNRIPKNLWSNLGEGAKIKYHSASSEREEAAFVADKIKEYHEKKGIALNQIAVFYRTHAQSRAFEDYFLNRKIPYVIIGGLSFYQRREIKDILAFLRVVFSGSDYISFLRTINLPKRGFGPSILEKIQEAATFEEMAIIPYLENLLNGTALHPVKLSLKQKEGLKEYLGLIQELKKIKELVSVGELVKMVIEESGYLTLLKEDQESYEDRKENLDALLAKAREWEFEKDEPTLGAFLEELSLKTSLDESGGVRDRLNLMTLHNGKGLEFKIAFLVGMEEDLFPHVNSRDNLKQLEEERRLCYVGMTRAKEHLYLTNCHVRYIWGTSRAQRPSRFVREIPFEYMEKVRNSIHKEYSEERYSRTFEKPKFKEKEVTFIDEIDQTLDLFKEEEEPFKVGESLFHPHFGVGILREITEGSLGKTFKIHFSNDNRERAIVAKYANLKKL